MTFANLLALLSDPGKWEDVLELDTHFRQFEGAGRILHSRQHAPTARDPTKPKRPRLARFVRSAFLEPVSGAEAQRREACGAEAQRKA